MASRELRQAIGDAAASRFDRMPREQAPEIRREGTDRGVALAGLLAQGLEADGVEVPPEAVRWIRGARVRNPALPLQRAFGRGGGGSRGAPGGGRGRLRLLLEHRALERSRIPRNQLERPHASDQLVEHDAQRVNVRGHRHRATADLLGARVGGSQGAQLGPRRRAIRAASSIGIDELRDPEVEEPRVPVRSDQDIAGLQVAVHDLALVRILDRSEHFDEEPQAVVDREPLLPRMREQILALDVLEGDVGAAVSGPSAVEKARDSGVFECGEELHLVAKTALGDRRGLPPIEPLDRHLAFEAFASLHGEIDAPHSPSSNLAEDAVRPDRGRQHRELWRPGWREGLRRIAELFQAVGQAFERRILALAGPQQLLELAREHRIAVPDPAQKSIALRPFELLRAAEELANRLPGHAPLSSSRTSQARANAQSRFTVRSETPRHSPISATSRPAK